jgi:hypothetical protein
MEHSGYELKPEVAAALERVGKIDLSKINKKLEHDNPKYWTGKLLADAEASYRRFLALNLLYPQETLAVNKVLDEYWHNHILDTRKYEEDCRLIFGSTLHHYPYFGLPGEPDEGEHVPAFAVTEQIWMEAFGTPIVGRPSPGATPRLTLDRVLMGLERADDGPDGGPKGCKNGQHCKKIIAPREIEASQPLVAVSQTAFER